MSFPSYVILALNLRLIYAGLHLFMQPSHLSTVAQPRVAVISERFCQILEESNGLNPLLLLWKKCSKCPVSHSSSPPPAGTVAHCDCSHLLIMLPVTFAPGKIPWLDFAQTVTILRSVLSRLLTFLLIEK